ncbi:MAG: prepilin-type N-terminal cleavage/methylation domain-containing protein [Patescibacteria group bacterium]|jgi:Tfp pilus assembly protein PilV
MKDNRGQTLLEVMAAMFILVFGILSVVSLVVMMNKISSERTQEVIAANLARESIEAVRAKRDSNWLAMEAGTSGVVWDTGLYGGASPSYDYTATINFSTTTNNWAYNWTPNVITNANCKIYKNSTTNFYTHTSTGGIVTPFTRLVYLYPVCSDGSEKTTGTCPLLTPKIGIHVTVQVQWTERGKIHNKYVEEKLYDWKIK